jgi:hypothetical protein
MLRPVSLVEQWREIERGLRADWGDARLALTVEDERRRNRAAALLGPLMPGRAGKQIRLFTARRGAGPAPQAVLRALRRLDRAGIKGTLELVASGEPALEAPEVARETLAGSWAAALATLPPDWSDLYVELELFSTDQLERGALLLAPVNPSRYGGRPGFRFRVARQFGYGASPQMTGRCLARLDEAGIRGRLEILHALSDTRPVATQGPVWYVGGRAV